MREATRQGIDFVKRLEGYMMYPYLDPAGLLSIGYGHLLRRSELSSGKIRLCSEFFEWQNGLNKQQAEILLDQDMDEAEAVLTCDSGARGLADHQYDALVSFTFNVGTEAYLASTLRKKLLAMDLEGAAEQFGRWRYAGGKVIRGLVRRRQAERSLFLNADYSG